MITSQAQVLGRPAMRTWNDYEAGCLATYGGGHRTDGQLEAFQHGMQTVFNLLRKEFPPAEQCKVAGELLARMKFALKYLEHPDVRSIPFSLNMDVIAEQCRRVVAKAEGDVTP